jgi:cell wall-associated NlpC family hydrolase
VSLHRSKTTGFNVLDVEPDILKFYHTEHIGRVKYKLGVKPAVSTKLCDVTTADCSGWVRWLMYHAAGVELPQGSWFQKEWFDTRNFKKSDYKIVAACKDNRLRVAFFDPDKSGVGHIWLILNGKTIECYSGQGVGRRRWNNSTLMKRVAHCYVVSDPLS